jgi:DNA/RNA-binding domain of Phe-tRNA-synthetase-like protein
MVTTDTTRALLLVFAPAETGRDRLAGVLDQTSRRMAEFTGCHETARWMADVDTTPGGGR